MLSNFFTTVFYQPLYNGLIFLISLSPWIDLGIAVVLFTCIVRLILFPLSRKAVRTQLRMKEIEPEMNEIKKKYKDNREEQARRTMALYKERGVNPFSGILLLLIQLPIIISLYQIFYSSGLPKIASNLLYSFVHTPHPISTIFLGSIDITQKSMVFALLAAASQYFQVKYSMPIQPKSDTPSFSNDLARSMSIQMKYVFPIVVFFIAYNISAAIAIYWLTSNLFTIGQEIYIRRAHKKAIV